MQIGAVLSQNELGAEPAPLRDYAQAAQGLGYQFLVAADHVVGADARAYPELDRVYPLGQVLHEPLTLFSFLAGVAPELGFLMSALKPVIEKEISRKLDKEFGDA